MQVRKIALGLGAFAAAMIATIGAVRMLLPANFEIAQSTAWERRGQIRQLHLPNISLFDQDGKKVAFYDDLVRGKVVAINFFYTACSQTCSVASQNISVLQDALGPRAGRDVFLYSISIDPAHDTPEQIARFRSQIGAGPGWSFLTLASQADADELRRKLGVFDPDPTADGDPATHTGMLIIGNEPEARWTMVPALLHPTRLRQAVDRVLLSPEQRANGDTVVREVDRTDTTSSIVYDAMRTR